VLFFILFSLSGYLNHVVLKDVIQDLRPADGIVFLASEKIRKRTNGMPSGHAQQTAFALTIAYLFTHKHLMVSIALFALTVLQRFVFRNHTLPQLIAGGALGLVLGYASYHIMRYLEKPIKDVEMTAYSEFAK
jgi:membrane-associated phospholipid phosphatase